MLSQNLFQSNTRLVLPGQAYILNLFDIINWQSLNLHRCTETNQLENGFQKRLNWPGKRQPLD